MINTKQNPKEYIVKDIIGFGWLSTHILKRRQPPSLQNTLEELPSHQGQLVTRNKSWQCSRKCKQYYESLSKQEKANRLEDLNLPDIEDILIAIKGKTPEPRAPFTPKTKDLATPLKKKKIKKHQLPQ